MLLLFFEEEEGCQNDEGGRRQGGRRVCDLMRDRDTSTRVVPAAVMMRIGIVDKFAVI